MKLRYITSLLKMLWSSKNCTDSMPVMQFLIICMHESEDLVESRLTVVIREAKEEVP